MLPCCSSTRNADHNEWCGPTEPQDKRCIEVYQQQPYAGDVYYAPFRRLLVVGKWEDLGHVAPDRKIRMYLSVHFLPPRTQDVLLRKYVYGCELDQYA